MLKKIITYILLLFVYISYGQERTFQQIVQELTITAEKVLNGETDTIRINANKKLNDLLIEFIETPKSYLYNLQGNHPFQQQLLL